MSERLWLGRVKQNPADSLAPSGTDNSSWNHTFECPYPGQSFGPSPLTTERLLACPSFQFFLQEGNVLFFADHVTLLIYESNGPLFFHSQLLPELLKTGSDRVFWSVLCLSDISFFAPHLTFFYTNNPVVKVNYNCSYLCHQIFLGIFYRPFPSQLNQMSSLSITQKSFRDAPRSQHSYPLPFSSLAPLCSPSLSWFATFLISLQIWKFALSAAFRLLSMHLLQKVCWQLRITGWVKISVQMKQCRRSVRVGKAVAILEMSMYILTESPERESKNQKLICVSLIKRVCGTVNPQRHSAKNKKHNVVVNMGNRNVQV